MTVRSGEVRPVQCQSRKLLVGILELHESHTPAPLFANPLSFAIFCTFPLPVREQSHNNVALHAAFHKVIANLGKR